MVWHKTTSLLHTDVFSRVRQMAPIWSPFGTSPSAFTSYTCSPLLSCFICVNCWACSGLAPFRPQNCSFTCRGLNPPSNTWFLGPIQDHIPNSISVGSATFAGPWVVILMAPHQRIGRDHQGCASSYHVVEHRSAAFESLQPNTDRSSRPGSEPSSVEADVYVWCYALLVVRARKEEEDGSCQTDRPTDRPCYCDCSNTLHLASLRCGPKILSTSSNFEIKLSLKTNHTLNMSVLHPKYLVAFWLTGANG